MSKEKKSNQLVGLSEKEAAKRLKKFGDNVVFQRKKFRPLVAFVKKFNSPFFLILIFASLLSFGIGQHTNATILLLMVFVSAILDFINSYKSEKAVQDLVSRVVTTATVIRGGKKEELEFKKIVPGDIVILSAGDIVPADCRILEGKDFFVNQSALTGEAFPVEKMAEVEVAEEEKSAMQQNNLVFLGTSVTTGYATAVVLKTGRATEFGKIADRLIKAEPATEFEKNIRQFSLFIMKITVILVGLVFFINAFLGRGWLTSFIFAVAIAIGLTPELLPVIISVALSRGSIQMAKKEVIVKNLSSIQNFGSMNVLCTDKTGTITENRIVLVRYMDGFGNADKEVLLRAYLNSYFYTGVRNPLDDAINTYKKLDISEYKKIDEVPFDFDRKKRSIVVERGKKRLLIAKGAPEEIFKICDTCLQKGGISKLDAAARKKINEQFENLSRDGFRVLGVAQKEVDPEAVYSKKDEEKMIFYGFVAFLDPPKATAREAIRELKDLGVELKILTGDNELLTERICAEISVACVGILGGDEIDKMTDAELQDAVVRTTIFARVTPEQKERVIINLRKAGKVVGYLGDGINDAPALKAGDIGISVANAVDVAKDTADIILLRKSLKVLRDGVIEGRKTFRNTLKYILIGLSSNFGNMFSMTAASAFLPFLPMLPTQILLNNFFYDMSQLTLSTDSVDEEDIKKPTVWSLKFIKKYMLVFGPISSLFDFLTFGALILIFHLPEAQFQTGWFIESLSTQVFVIYIIRTKKLPFFQSRPSKLLFLNTFFAVVMAWIIPFLALGKFFGFSPLSFTVSGVILGLTLVYLVLVEFAKRIFYKKYNHDM